MAATPDRPRRRRRVAGERAADRQPRTAATESRVDASYPLAPPAEPAGPPTPPRADRAPRPRPAVRDRLGRLRPGSRPLAATWTTVVAALTAVVVVLAVPTFFLQREYADRRDRTGDFTAGQEAARAAQEALTAMLSYDHRTFDEDVTAAEAFLTEDFATEYRTTQLDVVKRSAVKAKASVEADVVAAGAIRVEGERATVLVFVDQTSRNDRLPAPRIDKNRVRVELLEVGGRWLVDAIEPI